MKKLMLVFTLSLLALFSMSCGSKNGWHLVAGHAGFPPEEAPARLIVYQNKLWNISRSHSIWSSDNGISWVKTCAQVGENPSYIDDAFVYNDQMWVVEHQLLGAKNRFFHSSDGATWTELIPKNLQSGDYRAVAFNDQVWFLDTVMPYFFSSHDLLNWASDGPVFGNDNRFPLSGISNPLVFQGQLWMVLGRGRNMEVRKSADGHTWVQVPANLPAPIRWTYGFTKYKDELWLIGGQNSQQPDQFYNDAWFSKDGSHWTQTTLGFSPRCSMTGVEFKGKLWIIGGVSRAGNLEIISRLPLFLLRQLNPWAKPSLDKSHLNNDIWCLND